MQSFGEAHFGTGVSAGDVLVVLRVFSCGVPVYYCLQYFVQLFFLYAAGKKLRQKRKEMDSCRSRCAEFGDFVLF